MSELPVRTTVPDVLPRCDICGVEYTETYEGPCQEPRGVYHAYMGWPDHCPGKVSWRATALALARELESSGSHRLPLLRNPEVE